MRYAIIGAGLAGLSAAYELSQQDPEAQIEVFEATDRIGGKLCTIPFECGPVDMGAEAFLARDTEAFDFFTKELGLKTVAPSGLSSSIFSEGTLKPLPHAGMMGIPASSEPIRSVISEASAQRIDSEKDTQDPIAWTPGQDANVGAVVRERYGDDVVDRLVTALLGGVYSCTADNLGIRATIPALAATFDEMAENNEPIYLSAAIEKVLAKRRQAAGSAKQAGTGQGSIFASFAEGYREVYEALAEQSGARIYIDAFITEITRTASGFTLKGAGEGVYDRVLLATPAPTTALLLRTIAPEAAAIITGIKLASSTVVGMKFESDVNLPDNSGILIAADEPGMHAKAFTLSSKKWPHLGQRGGAIIRASFGRFGDEELVRADEDQLVEYALDDLYKTTGFDGRAAELSEIYVQRWFGGIPCFDEKILATVRAARENLDGIADVEVAGAWVSGVGVPAVLRGARNAARRLSQA